jgi:hypothetical protein
VLGLPGWVLVRKSAQKMTQISKNQQNSAPVRQWSNDGIQDKANLGGQAASRAVRRRPTESWRKKKSSHHPAAIHPVRATARREKSGERSTATSAAAAGARRQANGGLESGGVGGTELRWMDGWNPTPPHVTTLDPPPPPGRTL